MAVLMFATSVALLGSVAYLYGRVHGDKYRFDLLALFASIGAFAVFSIGSSLSTCIVLACVTVCAVTDLSSGFIYDVVTYPSFCILFVFALRSGTLGSALLSASITLMVCSMLHAISRGRGLGFGDTKLFTVVAMGLNSSIGEVAAVSFILGACFVGVALLRRRLSFGQTVPFAPFIALATLIEVPRAWLLR